MLRQDQCELQCALTRAVYARAMCRVFLMPQDRYTYKVNSPDLKAYLAVPFIDGNPRVQQKIALSPETKSALRSAC